MSKGDEQLLAVISTLLQLILLSYFNFHNRIYLTFGIANKYGNEIKSITVTRMIVPCCGGLEYAVKTAIKASGKDIPLRVVTIDTKGNIVA